MCHFVVFHHCQCGHVSVSCNTQLSEGLWVETPVMWYVHRKLVLAVRSAMKRTQRRVQAARHRRLRSCRLPLPTCSPARLNQLQAPPCPAPRLIIPTPQRRQRLHHPTVHRCYLSRSRRLLHSATFHLCPCFLVCRFRCSSRSSSRFLYTFNNRCSAVYHHLYRTNLGRSWDHRHQITLHHFL